MSEGDVLQHIARNTNNPTFNVDQPVRKKKATTVSVIRSDEKYNPEIDNKSAPPKYWSPEIREQVSSKKWLDTHGLKKQRLDIMSIYPQLGFKQVYDYDSIIKKCVRSRYGDKLFVRQYRPDGITFNITATKDELEIYEKRVVKAVQLFTDRLEWLTTDSRRIFGVIEEACVLLLLDIRNLSPKMFDQYLCSVERVINEQIVNCKKFNIVRCASDMEIYAEDLVPVCKDSITLAVDWLWKLDRLAPTTASDTVEGLSWAAANSSINAIYLFSEGDSSDGSREMLRTTVERLTIPLHIISYSCTNKEILEYLKSISEIGHGRFHAYAVTMEMESYEGMPLNTENNQANIIVKHKLYGGMPSGCGTRQDCQLIFEELENAKEILEHIQDVIKQMPDPKALYDTSVERDTTRTEDRKEEYLSSTEWITLYGIRSKKLDFYDVLAGISFKHCDGVVAISEPPSEVDLKEQQNCIVRPKLINAKYCDKFAHVRWKDGTLVHVQMTPEVHRLYEKRMLIELEAIQRRVDFLKQGSRELFGTIVEDQIYILIDTSGSIEPSMGFIKDKLFILMQEQLRHKKKFNFVAFNSKVHPWKDRVVDINESSLQAAWLWIKSLSCVGSTNTMAALQFALNDRHTHAIYVLTDGRPDQPPKTILAQVQMHEIVPIHTISFNCADKEANDFLFKLARDTGGRFHYYSEYGESPDCPDEWESEDIRVLKDELNLGRKYLEEVTILRDECYRLAWNRDTHKDEKVGVTKARDPIQTEGDAFFGRKVPGAKKKSLKKKKHNKEIKLLMDQLGPQKSFLRNASGVDGEDWLLKETKAMLDRQDDRYSQKIFEDTLKQIKESESTTTTPRRKIDPNDIRSWLKVYGLNAQKMTMLDLLAPTIVIQTPKYIDVLDKTVISKVFDDLLPIAHLSNKEKKTLRKVNPLAVDLKSYMTKLENLIQQYKSKFLSIVESNLSEEEFSNLKENCGGEIEYDEHYDEMIKAMEKEHWPVDEIDVDLLKTEIDRAKNCYSQGQDLLELRRKQTNVNNENQNKSDGENKSEGNSEKLKKKKVVVDCLKGQRVIARDDSDGLYYLGRVLRSINPKLLEVQFFDKKRPVQVSIRFCVYYGGAIPQPILCLHDFVLARVANVDNNRVAYVPGRIIELSVDVPGELRNYGVRLFNSPKHRMPRSDLIKIPEERYRLAVQSISAKLKAKDNKEQDSENSIEYDGPLPGRKKRKEPEYQQGSSGTKSTLSKRDQDLVKMLNAQSEQLQRLNDQLTDQSKHLRKQQKKLNMRLSEVANKQELEEKLDDVKDKIIDQTDDNSKLRKEVREQMKKLPQIDTQPRKHSRPHSAVASDKSRENAQKRSSSSSLRSQSEVSASNGRRKSQTSEVKKSTPDRKPSVKSPLSPLSPEIKRESLPSESRDSSESSVRGLCIGDEVLARWKDDGWYYRCVVIDFEGENLIVQDVNKVTSAVSRADIIQESQQASDSQENDTVIALYPDSNQHYGPALVLSVMKDTYRVRFYDSTEITLDNQECYEIDPETFESVVDFIKECEIQWIDESVVARNNDTGFYNLCQIEERVGTGKQYIIKWSDGTRGLQSVLHIFGAYTRKPKFKSGDRVLACADRLHLYYLPGWIVRVNNSTQKLSIRFCNGTNEDEVDPAHSFWISRSYYSEAVDYFKKKTSKS